jgi:hypothetical protein
VLTKRSASLKKLSASPVMELRKLRVHSLVSVIHVKALELRKIPCFIKNKFVTHAMVMEA